MEKGYQRRYKKGKNGRQHHGAWIKRGDGKYGDVGRNRSSEPLVWHETAFRCNPLGLDDPFRSARACATFGTAKPASLQRRRLEVIFDVELINLE